MTYLGFMECNWEDLEKVVGLSKNSLDERKKGSDKYGKSIFGSHIF